MDAKYSSIISITFIPLLSSLAHSLTNVPFLDVMVSLHNGTIETDDKGTKPFSNQISFKVK